MRRAAARDTLRQAPPPLNEFCPAVACATTTPQATAGAISASCTDDFRPKTVQSSQLEPPYALHCAAQVAGNGLQPRRWKREPRRAAGPEHTAPQRLVQAHKRAGCCRRAAHHLRGSVHDQARGLYQRRQHTLRPQQSPHGYRCRLRPGRSTIRPWWSVALPQSSHMLPSWKRRS